MKRTLFVVMLAMLPWTAEATPPDDTRAYCAELHQSYQMRIYCVSQEEASKRRVTQSAGLPYGIVPEIYTYCLGLHRSWHMVEYCGRQEMAAREQWNRR